MEGQPQNPEFRYNLENFHTCSYSVINKNLMCVLMYR